jgi:glycosyltransferase A (GT-A) superfamily protein (DUF2064 family)
MPRHLVLFAREPGREAREKGFAGPAAAALFAAFAEGWGAAARAVGARLVVATPSEDRNAWSLLLGDACSWIAQRGVCFGERLENAAREAAHLGGHAILVGGDVPPSPQALAAAFAALEHGAAAVLAPAQDGGISLLGLEAEDLDLLRSIAPRQRSAFRILHARLLSRCRRVEVIDPIRDIDDRASLRRLLAGLTPGSTLFVLTRTALSGAPLASPLDSVLAPSSLRIGPAAVRGPPAAA